MGLTCYNNPKMRVLIFGDSITQGFFDTKGGWVNRLAIKYQEATLKSLIGDWHEIFNLGVSGHTVQDVIDRVENETKARRWRDDPIAIVVAIGINDSQLISNKVLTEEYKFQEQYEKLVDLVVRISDQSLFVGLSAVDEKLTNPWEFSTGKEQFLNNRINLFEDCIKQVCEQKNVRFLPIHDMFIGQLDGKQSLLADGLHPDEAGHALLYEMIAPEIAKLLG